MKKTFKEFLKLEPYYKDNRFDSRDFTFNINGHSCNEHSTVQSLSSNFFFANAYKDNEKLMSGEIKDFVVYTHCENCGENLLSLDINLDTREFTSKTKCSHSDDILNKFEFVVKDELVFSNYLTDIEKEYRNSSSLDRKERYAIREDKLKNDKIYYQQTTNSSPIFLLRKDRKELISMIFTFQSLKDMDLYPDEGYYYEDFEVYFNTYLSEDYYLIDEYIDSCIWRYEFGNKCDISNKYLTEPHVSIKLDKGEYEIKDVYEYDVNKRIFVHDRINGEFGKYIVSIMTKK